MWYIRVVIIKGVDICVNEATNIFVNADLVEVVLLQLHLLAWLRSPIHIKQ